MFINSMRRGGVVVALLGTAALAAPVVATALPSTGSLGSTEPCSILSTEATPNGWGIPFEDEQDQTASYSPEYVLDQDGSLKLTVDGPSDRSVSYHSADGIMLSDAIKKPIGFAESAALKVAAFQLRLSGTTSEEPGGFTTLVWESTVPTTFSTFHANIQDGLWWSTRNIDGVNVGQRVSLADIAAANPDAVVDHYGVSLGTGSAATSTLVDQVQFNGCATNFAKEDPAPTMGFSLGSIFGS